MEVKLLMSSARESLKGRWGVAIAALLIYSLIIGAATLVNEDWGGVISVLIGGPFALGLAIFTLELSREGDPKIEMIFKGFNDFVRAFLTYLLMVLLIILWTLLLIIPGIIASISYSMTFYILAEDPSIKPMEAIDKSKAMMDGYKWKMFELGIYLFLLSLLCILTLGIGFLWLFPYSQVCCAKFYDEVKDNSSESMNDSDADNTQSSFVKPIVSSPESTQSEPDKTEDNDDSNESSDDSSSDEDENGDKPAE